MNTMAGQVLKADNVNMQGQYRLEVNPVPSASPDPSSAAATSAVTGTASVGPQVRIVENCNEYAVLEVTCGCGQKTLVQCAFQPPAA